MFFSEDVVRSIEENPIVGIVDACNMAMSRLNELESRDGWNENEHELMWEVASFLELAIEANQLYVDAVFPEATGELDENCKNLHAYISTVKDLFEGHSIKLKIESYKGRYQTVFKASFAYEFSQGDFDRIQTLVNELRDHIFGNDSLEADHKQRLLKRLESLQSELHKRVSDLDMFWGLVGDAGVVLGKLGTDSKPIVDRVKEVAEIVWKTQARTEELPSSSPNPMLGNEEHT